MATAYALGAVTSFFYIGTLGMLNRGVGFLRHLHSIFLRLGSACSAVVERLMLIWHIKGKKRKWDGR